MTEPTIVSKAMLTFPNEIPAPEDRPRSYLKYHMVVTDQDNEVVRETQLLMPTEPSSKEKWITLEVLLKMFNKVKQEPDRVVPERVIFERHIFERKGQ